MFIYNGKSYDNIYLNEDNMIALSRNDDGVIYELELDSPAQLEEITFTNKLSVQGLDNMYRELDLYETLVHKLYTMVKDDD